MKKHYFVLLASAVMTSLMFQNFIGLSFDLEPKYKVKNDLRREHAKEILGSKFYRSLAADETDDATLSLEVYNLVHRNTKNRFKGKKQKDFTEKVAKAILEQSNKYGIDPIFVASIIRTESAFNPAAVGTSGEIGLMQLMPQTAEYVSRRIKMLNFRGAKTLRDPVKNIALGVAYIHYLRQKFANQAYKYVPAYNMGPGNVVKSFARQERPKIYSSKVMKYYEQFYRQIYVSQLFKNPYLAQN